MTSSIDDFSVKILIYLAYLTHEYFEVS